MDEDRSTFVVHEAYEKTFCEEGCFFEHFYMKFLLKWQYLNRNNFRSSDIDKFLL